ncbi:MAG: HAMP domain-containing histidine kinase [Oscillospiraceae bacterium]|nr:HAMP domain-containing histidine kinase [Oscillospiraceae bacterium]MBR3962749.1 HAMP domain-containing histidine kinase [Oscillospiraceae bacterium]
MTSDKVSIRWKLCAYFIGFAVSMLVILWLMQTVLLDSIYALYTKETMKNHSETIAENIENPELNSLLISISQENELSIFILNSDGFIKSATERSTSVRFTKASEKMLQYWKLASENGGIYITQTQSSGVFTDSGDFLEYDPSHFTGNVPERNDYDSMIVATEIVSPSGERSLLLLLSRIEPIASVGEVLLLILSIASIFAFGAGIIFAYIASKGLASPIKKLSDSAKQLATGDYEVVFEGGGCSELTQLSETLNDSTQKLRKTDKLRKELLANVSHDLRTPLTMIGGYGEMMRDIPGENNSENIQIIIDETKRLTKLVNDALDLSKLQSGTFNFIPVVFCITDEVSDIVTQFEKLSTGKTDIIFESEGDIFVNADEVLVSEAIYNLINNAVNHGGENISITVRQTVTDKNVRISVIDNGRGIPPEMLDGIWERYQKGFGGGAGLGLAIVSTGIKMCGGTCGVKSELGKGSEFWIELPIYKN